jgi:hypothetical protein
VPPTIAVLADIIVIFGHVKSREPTR